MTLDLLAKLEDAELERVIEQSQAILKQRDEDRKAKALEQARATLAAVGLSLKDLNGKGHAKAKGAAYHGGHSYQHPTNKALVWKAKGQKPGWLRELEASGGKAVELP
jgi:DNA-binding protein H-NS